jgi:ubiquinone/menaquinone biosynthesis C-methylase UbiE
MPPKPSHVSDDYGAGSRTRSWSRRTLRGRRTQWRLITQLAELVADSPQMVLGTGDLAHRLAPGVDPIDAGDFSSGMIEQARQLSSGDAATVHWIPGAVEG